MAAPDNTAGRERKPDSLFVVGIGTSAGGLEALRSLFDNFDENQNMAFVVVQHLSPDYKSLMVELLSKHTRMKVYQVKNGMQVKAGSVYVMPPRKNLSIKEGKLMLTDKPKSVSVNFPIDLFFHSLGLDQKEKAIAVVLSGTGTDGSRGIKTIKEHGGIVIVQEPSNAKFNGMPVSAISTNLVDHILSTKEIIVELQLLSQLEASPSMDIQEKSLTKSSVLKKIFNLLKEVSGIDFNQYKQNTIYRRIDRRMRLNKFSELNAYYENLKEHPKELRALNNDLLIGVTQFFRDEKAFEALTVRVIPELFKDKDPNDQIRIWTPGCSTGEEAYSILMLVEEYKRRSNRTNPVKIFATDIDANAIEKAGLGTYPINIAIDIKPEFLSRYFIRKDNAYTINQEIRNQIVFARHNILSDPPFNKVDLIACRNLLIYLGQESQSKILSVFQFALNKQGFLFLGPSESVGEQIKFLKPIDKRWKIFQSTTEGRIFLPEMFMPGTINLPYSNYKGLLPSANKRNAIPGQIIESFKDALVDRFSPMAAFINIDLEVIYLAGGMNRFIRLPEKHLSLNILKMLPEPLVIPLSTAVRKVMKSGEPVRYESIQTQDAEEMYDLQVEALEENESLEQILLVSIYPKNPVPRITGEKPLPHDEMAAQRIEFLEQQLKDTRDSLQSTIEELETSNEELQASNEELMAANEELQSTNEELQSVNEELHTVNSELQAKIAELTELTSDMDNLLQSTDIGTIFLDEELRIRKFTPAIREQFNLMEQDTGRPISHFNADLGDENVVEDAREVLIKGETFEKELKGANDATYLMRILPYRQEGDTIKGVVITFINVSKYTERFK